MNLEEIYKAISPSIVALGSRAVESDQPPILPNLLGTGFVVDSRGIVATNKHVAEALCQLPPDPRDGSSLACAMVSGPLEDIPSGHQQLTFFAGIRDYVVLAEFSPSDEYYGDPSLDIALIQLEVCNLPALTLATEPDSWRIGMPIATAGFPLGEEALVAYGKLRQVTPFLRQGIISSLNPYQTHFPDGFTIDIMTLGGESGSPVFLTDSPTVVGVIYEGFDFSNITMAIPSHLVSRILEDAFHQNHFDFSNLPTLVDAIKANRTNPGFNWQTIAKGS